MSEKKGKQTQTTVTVDGETYTIQKVVPSEWMKLKQRCTDRQGRFSEAAFIREIFEHMIVKPRISPEAMDELDWAVVDELSGAAIDFQTGKAVARGF